MFGENIRNRRVSFDADQEQNRGFWKGFLLGTAFGVAGMLLLDPTQGRKRREKMKDSVVNLRKNADDVIEELPKKMDYISGYAEGAKKRVMNSMETKDTSSDSDELINDRVLSTIFRDPEKPKGDININTVAGVVYVRGATEHTDQIDDIITEIAKVDGVRDVVNLINQPDVDPSTIETKPSS